MTRRRIVALAVSLAALTTGIAGYAWLRPGAQAPAFNAVDVPDGWDDPRADPADAARVALGERVYAQHCAACHGAKLEGQPNWRSRLPNGRLPAPPHDETGHTWHHPDRLLFAITKEGLVPPYAPAGYESDMPAFTGKLADDEIWAALAFVKSRWTSREVREARAQMSASASTR